LDAFGRPQRISIPVIGRNGNPPYVFVKLPTSKCTKIGISRY
jgi:hypothetical protein